MNRRSFVKKSIIAGILAIAGNWQVFAERPNVRKILYALKLKKYPGKIKPLGKLTSNKDLLG